MSYIMPLAEGATPCGDCIELRGSWCCTMNCGPRAARTPEPEPEPVDTAPADPETEHMVSTRSASGIVLHRPAPPGLALPESAAPVWCELLRCTAEWEPYRASGRQRRKTPTMLRGAMVSLAGLLCEVASPRIVDGAPVEAEGWIELARLTVVKHAMGRVPAGNGRA